MRKIFILIIFFLSNTLLAEDNFEWNGINAGMSPEEVEAITACSDGSCNKDETEAYFENNGLTLPAGLLSMEFAFTSVSNELWRIQLDFWESKGSERAAQLTLLNKYYPDTESQSGTYNLGTYSFKLNVDTDVRMIVDKTRFQDDIAAIIERDEPSHM